MERFFEDINSLKGHPKIRPYNGSSKEPYKLLGRKRKYNWKNMGVPNK
jgi:hypothetical protein